MARDEDSGNDHGIGPAARALMEAAAELTKAVSKGAIDDVTHRAGAQVSEALRDAAAAVERAGRRSVGRGSSTREDLLVAAGQVIAEKGFHAASLGEVAVRAGYTKGAIYAHFSSKDDLMLALMRRGMGASGSEQESTLVTAHREHRLAEVLGAADGPDGGQDPTDSLLGIEMMLYALRHPEHHEEFRQALQEGVEDLARQLSADPGGGPAGQDARDVAPTPDQLGGALAFAAIVNFGGVYGAIGVPAATGSILAAVIDRAVGRGESRP